MYMYRYLEGYRVYEVGGLGNYTTVVQGMTNVKDFPWWIGTHSTL